MTAAAAALENKEPPSDRQPDNESEALLNEDDLLCDAGEKKETCILLLGTASLCLVVVLILSLSVNNQARAALYGLQGLFVALAIWSIQSRKNHVEISDWVLFLCVLQLISIFFDLVITFINIFGEFREMEDNLGELKYKYVAHGSYFGATFCLVLALQAFLIILCIAACTQITAFNRLILKSRRRKAKATLTALEAAEDIEQQMSLVKSERKKKVSFAKNVQKM